MNKEIKKDDKNLRKHFLQSLYQTLDGVVSPTPLLEISEGDVVDVKFLDGKGRLPKPKTTEVTVLDIDSAAMFFDDFDVLKEGITGVGKTYTSDAIFDAVFGRDGHYTLRLSGGVLGSSALEPFTTTTLENGVPKTRIDHDKCAKYGALFIDEINRGDSNEVFQVVDRVINLNGDTGYLRIPIPDTKRYKGLVVIAAMNPADAQHSGALELDIAGENRFLKFKFPNGVSEAASTQLEKIASVDLHDKFWTEFERRTDIKDGWKVAYPLVTDPEKTKVELDGESREFIDVSLGYVGEDPIETYERNVELIKQGGVEPRFSIRTDNDLDKIIEAQNTLKHGFVRRDLKKIRNLSRLLGFIKSMKDGSYDPKVSVNDVSASIGVVLESKTITGTENGKLIALVNDARNAYGKLRTELKVPEGFGLRQAILQSALYAGQEKDFDAYINTLRQGIARLNTQASTVANATLRSRMLADLVVLEYFSKMYEREVKEVLKQGEKAYEAFTELYEQKKGSASIYEHRLGSIIK